MQRHHRLLDAVEEMVFADQRFEPQPRKALLRAHGFETRERDVDALGAQPPDQIAENFAAGIVDFHDRVRLDDDELYRPAPATPRSLVETDRR